MQFQTLVEALEHNRSDDRFVGLIDGPEQEKKITFSELRTRALGLLFVLQEKGLNKGDYLILNLHDNEQMIDVFWACQFGGIVPVPLAIGISDQHRQKVFNVYNQLVHDGKKAFLYTDRKTFLKLQSNENSKINQALSEQVILTDDVSDISFEGKKVDIAPEDISFIQFSSGSTGSPKGVVLKHRNLLANIDGIQQAAAFTTDDTSLGWMPLTHDMGLIGFHLNPIVCNYNHYIMRTDLFVRRPLYWLTAASDKKANVLCSPNFGYKHFLNAYQRKKSKDNALDDIDLSHVRLVFNGAEPISVNLCEQFTTELAKFGLPKNSMFPVYGLAEASLAVSFPEVYSELKVINVKRESLTISTKAEIVQQDESTSTLVCVGSPIPHCNVRISDENGNELPMGTIGHIHIGGKNVTEEIIGDDGSIFYEGGWVNTGDLGFVSEYGLFITGRFKEILFVNGQNYYPHDIENALQNVPGFEQNFELGKVVVAGITSGNSDLEQVLVFVLHKGKVEDFKEIAIKVRGVVNEQFGIEVHHVIPIRKVPKTTSGKVQRSSLADLYLDGEFAEVINEFSPKSNTSEDLNDKNDDEMIKAIKKICAEALPDKTFTVNDSLLEIGASSLALVEIHSGIDELFPNQIEITDLVDHSTITELAHFLKNKQ